MIATQQQLDWPVFPEIIPNSLGERDKVWKAGDYMVIKHPDNWQPFVSFFCGRAIGEDKKLPDAMQRCERHTRGEVQPFKGKRRIANRRR